jgi:hypothetical protein
MWCKIPNYTMQNIEKSSEIFINYSKGEKILSDFFVFKCHRVFAKWWYALSTSMWIAYSCSQLAYGLTIDQSLWHFNYSYVIIFWSALSYFRYVYLYFRYWYSNHDISLYYAHTMYVSWFILFCYVVFVLFQSDMFH